MIGIIGCGYWGNNIIRECYNLNILKIICDKDINILNKFKELYDVDITTNFDDLLNSNINAIIISLPTELHYEYAKKTIENKKHVFIEKPMTSNLKEAKELVKLAKEYNVKIMVGHILNYHPCIIKIKELINNNIIGNIRNITCNRLNLGRFRKYENVLWSFAPHDISIILSICNKLPDKLYCHGKDILRKGIHDITNTFLEYDKENIYININVNWLNPFKEQKMIITGEKGMIVFDDTLEINKILLYKNELTEIKKTDGVIIEYENLNPLKTEIEHFINCYKNNKEPLTNGEEGLKVLQVLELLTESLYGNGKIINLNNNFHQSSIIESNNIGYNTKIWHFCHITPSAIIGNNCNIGQNCYIAGKIGNNCKIQNNVSVYKGVECGDYVFLGPSCVFTNDKYPDAKISKNGNYLKTIIEDEVTIGANATILPGIRIGKNAFIGAGAVVTKDVLPYSTVIGNPAINL